MIMNFLLVSLRNYTRYKTISLINILGLVLGFLCSLLILEYVFYERSFDRFHTRAPDIYRLAYDRYQGEKLLWKTANSFCPSGPFLKDNFSEVEDYATIQRFYDITVCRENDQGARSCFNENKSYYATNSFLSIFNFKIIKGKPDCLSEPNTAVITERGAKKYFKDEDPIGKIVTVNNQGNFIITGILQDIPKNSHLQFDFLFSFSTIVSGPGNWMLNNWEYDYFYNYVLLKNGTDSRKFAEYAFPKMISRNYEEIQKNRNEHDHFYLQPLEDIHLYSNIEYEAEKPGNGEAVKVLFGFSLFLLIIAWINYINLITSRSLERAREVGIRKVSGSSNRLLIIQFLLETFLLNLFSLGITLIIFMLINPAYSSWLDIDPSVMLHHINFRFIAMFCFLAGILLSGLYPAFVLSSFNPLRVLKGVFKNSHQGMILRKSLVSFQFFISFILLFGTIISYRQVQFLMNRNMGINYSSMMVFKTPKPEKNKDSYTNKIEVLRNTTGNIPWVTKYTMTTDVPGEEINNWFWCYRKGFDAGDGKAYFRIGIDENYFDFFNIKFLAGRGFSRDRIADKDAMIINESAMRRLGYNSPDEAVNQIVSQGQADIQIIGVVNDFHYKSVKVEPVPTFFNWQEGDKPYVALKYPKDPDKNTNQYISEVEGKFHKIFPDSPFEYFFLEDKISSDLAPDKSFRSVFGVFSILAVFVALIGLLGLLYITVNQNMKTMVIRIILGAQKQNIFSLLSIPFFLQVLVAFSLAIPLSYYLFWKWITKNYIYHIPISWYYFIFPVIFLVIISSFLVYSQVRRTFSVNLTEILKYE